MKRPEATNSHEAHNPSGTPICVSAYTDENRNYIETLEWLILRVHYVDICEEIKSRGSEPLKNLYDILSLIAERISASQITFDPDNGYSFVADSTAHDISLVKDYELLSVALFHYNDNALQSDEGRDNLIDCLCWPNTPRNKR